MNLKIALAALGFVSAASMALADVGHEHGQVTGKPSQASEVDRQIELSMDEMDFDPDEIEVAPGETIRFVVSNDGNAVHEFNIGTPEAWDAHSSEMLAMMREGVMTARKIRHEKMQEKGMMHDDPSSVLLEPGQTAELIWTFPEDSSMLGFACNVPGHRAGGMVGDFVTAGEETTS